MSKLKLGLLQVGRSPTASLNFHIRNLLDGLLRITRGFPEAPIADVVRVNADNTVEFPGGIKGGFSKEYVSPEQTIVAGGLLTLAHGLGSKPKLVTGTLVNVTTDGNYVPGDEVQVTLDNQGTNSLTWGASVVTTATDLQVRPSATAGSFILLNKTATSAFQITNANWRLIVRAWA